MARVRPAAKFLLLFNLLTLQPFSLLTLTAQTVELPKGYVTTEYVKSTRGGGQFIDTGYTANAQTKIVFDALIPVREEQEDQYGVLFGTRTMNDWAAKAFALQMCKGNSGVDTVRFTYNGADRQDAGKPFSYGERVTVTCDGRHIEWTGSKAASVEFDADALDRSKSTLYIFADNTVENGAKSKTGLNHSVMRLYSFRIYEGETLKRNFVPCVRLEDNTAGLYDTAEGKFYKNAGTGAALAAPKIIEPLDEVEVGHELEDNHLYYLIKSRLGPSKTQRLIAWSAGESALKVKPGATVAIYIESGVTLDCNGGDGSGQTGGGAGILVPKNSTLVVTGGGTLSAYGGKAADGAKGSDAQLPKVLDSLGNNVHNMHYSTYGASGIRRDIGVGGTGGGGGGGGGAGIGGAGGRGGDGGGGGSGYTSSGWDGIYYGNSGYKGNAGEGGGSFGRLYALGVVTITARADTTQPKGGGGGAYSGLQCTWAGNYYPAYGSGGGGGGGGGGYGDGIGIGGSGGGGGGGGGSGSLSWYATVARTIGWDHSGRGGGGGESIISVSGVAGAVGQTQKGSNATVNGGTYSVGNYGTDTDVGAPAIGGGGGSAGTQPATSSDSGIYRSATARVNGNVDSPIVRDTNVISHESIGYSIKFADPKNLLESVPGEKTVYLGMPLPQVNPSTAASEEYAMAGWYDAEVGGTKYYDNKGKPLFATYVHYASDLTLYPQLEAAALNPTGVKVNGREIGGKGVEPPDGCVFGVTTRLSGAGPFTLSGENLNGLVRFVVEGSEKVAITLDGLHLRNERKNIGLIDIPAGSSAEITLKGTANYLEATGESSSAIHCPTGATVKIVGVRERTQEQRKVEACNDWTVADNPFWVKVDWMGKSTIVELSLKSGPGAAAIGGNRNEPCGDITLDNCDLSCTPNAGIREAHVHEIGNGLMGPSPTPAELARGGHVTYLNLPAMRCPNYRSAEFESAGTLTLVRPRPHDEYGVPLTPAWHGPWVLFYRPGLLQYWDEATYVIPRSGKSVKANGTMFDYND